MSRNDRSGGPVTGFIPGLIFLFSGCYSRIGVLFPVSSLGGFRPVYSAKRGLFLGGFMLKTDVTLFVSSAQTPDLSRLNASLISVIPTHHGTQKGVFYQECAPSPALGRGLLMLSRASQTSSFRGNNTLFSRK